MWTGQTLLSMSTGQAFPTPTGNGYIWQGRLLLKFRHSPPLVEMSPSTCIHSEGTHRHSVDQQESFHLFCASTSLHSPLQPLLLNAGRTFPQCVFAAVRKTSALTITLSITVIAVFCHPAIGWKIFMQTTHYRYAVCGWTYPELNLYDYVWCLFILSDLIGHLQ